MKASILKAAAVAAAIAVPAAAIAGSGMNASGIAGTNANSSAYQQAAKAERGDIVDIAAKAGQFNTLLTAAKAAGLVATLKGPGPFTLFAPTDNAFAKLPKGTVATLLKPENKAKLAAILKYHVVPGRILSSDIAGKKAQVATVEGRKLSVDAMDGVTVDNARVIKADILATNGVIHVIDTVVLPK